MKVAGAMLCMSCDELFESSFTECPKCLDKVIYPLKKWFPCQSPFVKIEPKIIEKKGKKRGV